MKKFFRKNMFMISPLLIFFSVIEIQSQDELPWPEKAGYVMDNSNLCWVVDISPEYLLWLKRWKHVLYLSRSISTIDLGSLSQSVEEIEEYDEIIFATVTEIVLQPPSVVHNDIYKSAGVKYEYIIVTDKGDFLFQVHCVVPKSVYDQRIKNPNSPPPKYELLKDVNFTWNDPLRMKIYPVYITEKYDNGGMFLEWEKIKEINSNFEKYIFRKVFDYGVMPVQLEYDERYVFLLLYYRENYIDAVIKNVYPVRVEKGKIGNNQFFTSHLIYYKESIVDNYLVLAEYSSEEEFSRAKNEQIWAKALRIWKFDINKTALVELPESEYQFIKCRRVTEKDLPAETINLQ